MHGPQTAKNKRVFFVATAARSWVGVEAKKKKEKKEKKRRLKKKKCRCVRRIHEKQQGLFHTRGAHTATSWHDAFLPGLRFAILAPRCFISRRLFARKS